MNTPVQICVNYHIVQTDKESGEVLYEVESPNLVVRLGREYVLRGLFNLSPTSFLYMGAGASSTAATIDDTQLEYELIGNVSRKTGKNTSGGSITAADILSGTYSVGGGTYYELLPIQVTYDGSTDGNVDATFTEYALFDSATLPGTPTATSGKMFNRYIPPGLGTTLTSSTLLTVTANIYI